MKPIYYCILLLTFTLGCSPKEDQKELVPPPKKEQPVEIVSEDTIVPPASLDSFQMLIEYPEDIMLYKSRKRGANNGSAHAKKYYHTPDTIGFFYHFLLFYPKPPRIHPSEMFDGMGLIVYRYGKQIGHYGDTNEEFISLWSKVNEPELRTFDLVGKSASDITALLGDNYFTKDKLRIYTSTNKVLVVSMNGDTVDWFRYTILNFEIKSADDLPHDLSEF